MRGEVEVAVCQAFGGRGGEREGVPVLRQGGGGTLQWWGRSGARRPRGLGGLEAFGGARGGDVGRGVFGVGGLGCRGGGEARGGAGRGQGEGGFLAFLRGGGTRGRGFGRVAFDAETLEEGLVALDVLEPAGFVGAHFGRN